MTLVQALVVRDAVLAEHESVQYRMNTLANFAIKLNPQMLQRYQLVEVEQIN